MPVYNRKWGEVDSGREGLWQPEKWRAVIEAVANHPGARFYDPESPLNKELEKRVPDEDWIANAEKRRPLFRDYRSSWDLTGTIRFDDQTATITDLGERLLDGTITRKQLLLRMMRGLKFEDHIGERPYGIFASAFLEWQGPLDFGDIRFGVAERYRPSWDDIHVVLNLVRSLASVASEGEEQDNLKRKLKHMLRRMDEVGAITRIPGPSPSFEASTWLPANGRILRYIAKEREANVQIETLVAEMNEAFRVAGLHYDSSLLVRYVSALLAKRFVVLTGLSGSGKTKLAQAFAHWITGPNRYRVVAVGADWTSNEHILGYADALDPERYVRTDALDLIVSAANNPDMPYFLILDEMNLSHVEQYFADLLSSIESGAPLRLHNAVINNGAPTEIQGIEPSMALPPNLFVIGTVNVDETTYMFSPKVLDRSNVVEFRVSKSDIESYLEDPDGVDLNVIQGIGVEYANAFLGASREDPDLDYDMKNHIKAEFTLLFDVLEKYGAEFGFRTVHEAARFVHFYHRLSGSAQSGWNHNAIDAQIMQKILPKLHGSRRQLEPLLSALAAICYIDHQWDSNNGVLANSDHLLEQSGQWVNALMNPALDPDHNKDDAYYPLSYQKIQRMLRMLVANGFASYAEA